MKKKKSVRVTSQSKIIRKLKTIKIAQIVASNAKVLVQNFNSVEI